MASSHGAPPVFNNKVIAWIDHRLPIFSYLEKEYHTFPTPRNFNYFWNFGAIGLALLLLAISRWFWRIGVRQYSGASA